MCVRSSSISSSYTSQIIRIRTRALKNKWDWRHQSYFAIPLECRSCQCSNHKCPYNFSITCITKIKILVSKRKAEVKKTVYIPLRQRKHGIHMELFLVVPLLQLDLVTLSWHQSHWPPISWTRLNVRENIGAYFVWQDLKLKFFCTFLLNPNRLFTISCPHYYHTIFVT